MINVPRWSLPSRHLTDELGPQPPPVEANRTFLLGLSSLENNSQLTAGCNRM